MTVHQQNMAPDSDQKLEPSQYGDDSPQHVPHHDEKSSLMVGGSPYAPRNSEQKSILTAKLHSLDSGSTDGAWKFLQSVTTTMNYLSHIEFSFDWNDQGWGLNSGEMRVEVSMQGAILHEHLLPYQTPHKRNSVHYVLAYPHPFLRSATTGCQIIVSYRVAAGLPHLLELSDFIMTVHQQNMEPDPYQKLETSQPYVAIDRGGKSASMGGGSQYGGSDGYRRGSYGGSDYSNPYGATVSIHAPNVYRRPQPMPEPVLVDMTAELYHGWRLSGQVWSRDLIMILSYTIIGAIFVSLYKQQSASISLPECQALQDFLGLPILGFIISAISLLSFFFHYYRFDPLGAASCLCFFRFLLFFPVFIMLILCIVVGDHLRLTTCRTSNPKLVNIVLAGMILHTIMCCITLINLITGCLRHQAYRNNYGGADGGIYYYEPNCFWWDCTLYNTSAPSTTVDFVGPSAPSGHGPSINGPDSAVLPDASSCLNCNSCCDCSGQHVGCYGMNECDVCLMVCSCDWCDCSACAASGCTVDCTGACSGGSSSGDCGGDCGGCDCGNVDCGGCDLGGADCSGCS
eukprot:TRINITY_DN5719_c0_g3_i1.p1 TRINITY_DN5719_c0_g3~~TRINITY_DN5719_c0_g3_i1.p1  ORF type:complete len:570 (+),score=53.37 TRINITY_DN5719_c0_g3_i1:2-1711(+)